MRDIAHFISGGAGSSAGYSILLSPGIGNSVPVGTTPIPGALTLLGTGLLGIGALGIHARRKDQRTVG